MQNSILELKKEIYQDEQFNFHARIHIIFMTNSAHTFALLDPANIPTSDIAIDVWILRNQKVILSTVYEADSGLNWQFSTFETNLKTDFQQDITVTTQDYNQVLVLRGGIFSFISFDSTATFSCKNTSHLFQVGILFGQIIEQENAFLTELTQFQTRLHQAQIITTTSTISPIISPRPKRNIVTVKSQNIT